MYSKGDVTHVDVPRSISTRLYRRHAFSQIESMRRSSSLEQHQIPENKPLKTKNDVYKMTGETGSYRYMAPEVFRHETYNEKVDVYAFAMIFYELLEGIPPFIDHDPVTAARQAAIGTTPVSHFYRSLFCHRASTSHVELSQLSWGESSSRDETIGD